MKNNLKENLKIALEALENDTVNYQWDRQSSCNCGVVIQAMCGITEGKLQNRINEERLFNDNIFDGANGKSKTWKNAIKLHCPITGDSIKQIFNDLKEKGLTTKEMTHLEFLNNKEILENTDIKTFDIVEKEVFSHYEIVKDDSFFGKLFNLNKKVEKYVIIKEEKPNKYYREKQNLIKYLKSWIDILDKSEIKEEKLINNIEVKNFEYIHLN